MTDSKNQILQTALRLFLKNSYKEVSLRDIVNEVGLTKGAFYHYYTSKEQLFEEAVRYFYNHAIITDYNEFPKNSLKEFYNHYLYVLSQPDEMDEKEGDMNFFIFLNEASKRIPHFLKIHDSQRRKELQAWTGIIETARQTKEITSRVPAAELAVMFLNMSDGISLHRGISKMDGNDSITRIKRDWDNLYNLLKNND